MFSLQAELNKITINSAYVYDYIKLNNLQDEVLKDLDKINCDNVTDIFFTTHYISSINVFFDDNCFVDLFKLFITRFNKKCNVHIINKIYKFPKHDSCEKVTDYVWKYLLELNFFNDYNWIVTIRHPLYLKTFDEFTNSKEFIKESTLLCLLPTMNNVQLCFDFIEDDDIILHEMYKNTFSNKMLNINVLLDDDNIDDLINKIDNTQKRIDVKQSIIKRMSHDFFVQKSTELFDEYCKTI